VANLLQLGVARSPEAWEKVRQLEKKNCNVQKYQTSNETLTANSSNLLHSI